MQLSKLLMPWLSELSIDCDIRGLQHDSRRIQAGDLFIAYPGALSDGRLHISQAVKAGAAAVVYEPQHCPDDCSLSFGVPCLPIPNLAEQLALIAAAFYEQPSSHLMVTGVTGTNGKTTIAYQLAQAYEYLNEKAAYIGTLGEGSINALNPLNNTTPDGLCLHRLLHHYKTDGYRQICMEVSSHALAQKRVEGVHFTQAIYTNLSHEHLDYHRTMEAYVHAKSRLFTFESLKTALINQDDAYAPKMLASLHAGCEKLTYGLYSSCDLRAVQWQVTSTGSELCVQSPWGKYALSIQTLGEFNLYNSLAIFGALLLHGYTPNQLIPVMARLQASPGRMEVVAESPSVIVDYAHTPDALDNVLSTLTQLKRHKLILVFGCGGDRDKAKRPLMGRIASQYADRVILTNDNPRTEHPEHIIAEIKAGLLAGFSADIILDRRAAIEQALSLADSEDIILIAGKGHETYQQIGQTKMHFSDQEVVRMLLA